VETGEHFYIYDLNNYCNFLIQSLQNVIVSVKIRRRSLQLCLEIGRASLQMWPSVRSTISSALAPSPLARSPPRTRSTASVEVRFFFLQNVLIIIDIYKASLVLSTSTASVEVRFFSFKMFLSLSIYIKQV
jgi:hypothetical protein